MWGVVAGGVRLEVASKVLGSGGRGAHGGSSRPACHMGRRGRCGFVPGDSEVSSKSKKNSKSIFFSKLVVT